jgi:prolyl-tRNA editing enzyme YbaK/EbsC (Cys-tRNA(Pro) deacylase)
MTVQWPTEVERVSGFLRQMGAEARVEEFSAGTPTAVEAAQAVGCKLGQIVKSLVFDCDGRWVVVLVPGDRRADRDKIAAAAGAKKARIAKPEEVERATGFVAGAVLAHKRVWIGAGSPSHMAEIAPGDLIRLARAQPMDAVEAAT